MKQLSLTRKYCLLFVLVTFGLALYACYPITLQPRPEGEPLFVTSAPQVSETSTLLQSPSEPPGSAGDVPGENTPTTSPPPIEALPTVESQATPTVQESIIFDNPEAVVVDTPPAVEETNPGGDSSKPVFDSFVESLKNGNPNQIVGVYVDGILALRVVQQPPGNAAYVSIRDGEATQFLLAWTIAGNVGLLAHNYLAGVYYFNLRSGDIIELVYGDGSVVEYEVDALRQYQALSPNSSTSDFVNLDSGATLTATNLFYEVYGGNHHVTFQTCIARDNSGEWGRLFVLAPPL
jgi:hypothetical protein